ncbi:MAG: RecX family transcriptional regulator [Dehalococcoidia bacterium]|nr:RecX family transcriptional regulator [Dehalococcoidia bacterium]
MHRDSAWPVAAMRITAIEEQPRSRRLKLVLDGGCAVPVSREVLARFTLLAGDEITDGRLRELEEAEAHHLALSSALHLLAYRPRSEAELRERLARKGVRPDVLGAAIARLRELSLIDDAAFARTWVEGRERTSPRSRRLLASELRAKGVQAAVAQRSAEMVDEAGAAYRAALKRAAALKSAPYAEFRRKLGDLLMRRGFEYETASAAIGRLREELRGGQGREELRGGQGPADGEID